MEVNTMIDTLDADIDRLLSIASIIVQPLSPSSARLGLGSESDHGHELFA